MDESCKACEDHSDGTEDMEESGTASESKDLSTFTERGLHCNLPKRSCEGDLGKLCESKRMCPLYEMQKLQHSKMHLEEQTPVSNCDTPRKVPMSECHEVYTIEGDNHTPYMDSLVESTDVSKLHTSQDKTNKFQIKKPGESDTQRTCTLDGDQEIGENMCDDRSVSPINTLPQSLLIKVFAHLKLADLLLRASLVCRYWHDLTHDPELWRTIDLRGLLKVTDKILAKLASISNNVQEINLTDAKVITNEGIACMAQSCTHLKILKMVRNQKVSDTGFAAIGEHCRHLQHLNLDCCFSLTDLALSMIARGCQALEVLVLSQCVMLTDSSIKAVSAHCHNLKSLSLSHCKKIGDESLEDLAKGCPQLESLRCMSCKFNAAAITLHICRMKKLHTLELADVKGVNDDVVQNLVLSCQALITLNLSLCTAVTDKAVTAIAKHLPHIQHLYLVSCKITDEAMSTLGRCCPNLDYLDVGWCEAITVQGARQLATCCPNLRTLCLVRCDLVSVEESEDLCCRYPNVHFSTTWLDLKRVLQKAQEQGFVTSDVPELDVGGGARGVQDENGANGGSERGDLNKLD